MASIIVYQRNGLNFGEQVAEWLSHSAVVQEVPGLNPGAAESVTFLSLPCV